MKIIDIIAKHLKDNGYDGLCHTETECGCFIDDIHGMAEFHVCQGDFSQCEPAHKIQLPPGDERGDGWWMVPTKEGQNGQDSNL